MSHKIINVIEVEYLGRHKLRLRFDDGLEREIDFLPVLAGKLFAPLRDEKLFAQARLDPECHTIVWPNGADFDPATLHDWPKYARALKAQARRWELAHA